MERTNEPDFNIKKVHNVIYGIDVNHNNRLNVFIDHIKEFTEKEFWYGLSLAYPDCDFIEPKELVRACFTSRRKFREYLMEPNEYKYLLELPQKFVVYRAANEIEINREYGFSWTLSKQVAEFFKNDYIRGANRSPRKILTFEVNKDDVIAFFDSRNEKEVIILEVKNYDVNVID